ncbi:MAG: hypothetical protein M2R45_04868 [Verrucomicrobia subdivision 3 bacterium]|nr:hypothetical protein [Limisphaerales bacterium]MCS1417525.1 hypothetical protein [Limisphaerales bacterium]
MVWCVVIRSIVSSVEARATHRTAALTIDMWLSPLVIWKLREFLLREWGLLSKGGGAYTQTRPIICICECGNGAKLKLITTSQPIDKMATGYLSLLAKGNGGAFVWLQRPSLVPLIKGMKTVGISGPAIGWERSLARSGCFTRATLAGVWCIENPEVGADQPRFT